MRTKREVPPESQTMGSQRISDVFDLPGHGCGRNGGMVLPYYVNTVVLGVAKAPCGHQW